jgi:glycosyltransferase involved in cell wall biosynthesis
MLKLSVIIPTYNPDPERLERTLAAMKAQTLSKKDWELIIVDNNSSPSIEGLQDGHPLQKLVREPKPGLTYARLKGFDAASGELLVMVDDDNVLDREYLRHTAAIFRENPDLGAIGGKSLPLFESPPPEWLKPFYGSLALRDPGNEVRVCNWTGTYPAIAPIGAGMGIRRSALSAYLERIKNSGAVIADRTKGELGSGGDNDIVLEILKAGWQVGYFPSLELEHLIPASRMQAAYLGRLLNHTNRSWVRVLEQHRINPWKSVPGWTVPFRKAKAWYRYRAWKNEANYINWRGACGHFDGLASI